MITNNSITQPRGGTVSSGTASRLAFTISKHRSIVNHKLVGAGQQRENPWCTDGAQRVHAAVLGNHVDQLEGNHHRRTEVMN
jgi:hypothetical protein